MEPFRKTTYDLHLSSGGREQGLSVEEVERRIRAGLIGELDLLSVLGGAPKPYWHFPRFGELQPKRAESLPAPAAAGRQRGPAPTLVPPTAALLMGSSNSASLPTPSAVLRALKEPELVEAPSAEAVGWRAPRLFPEGLMRLRPQALKARLLESTVQDVVGCGKSEPPEYALACARARLSQLETEMGPRCFEAAELAALREAMGLISQACTLLAFASLKAKLEAREQELGRQVILREVLPLALALDDALEQVGGKAARGRPRSRPMSTSALSMISGAVRAVVGGRPPSPLAVPPSAFLERLRQTRIEDAVGALPADSPEQMAVCARDRLRQVEKNVSPLAKSSEERDLLQVIRGVIAQCFVVLAHPELSRILSQRKSRAGRQLTVAEVLDLAPAAADAVALLTASNTVEALGAVSASSILSKANAASEARLREFDAMMSEPPPLDVEPLQWGSGDEDDGARSIAVPLATVLLAGVALAFFFPTGIDEMQPELEHAIHYGRAFALTLAAFFAVRGVRFEAFSRFGWRPAVEWQWSLALLGGFAGAVLGGLLKSDPNAAVLLVPALVLSLLRGVSEGLFFEGLVARTLLLDVEQPMKGIGIAGTMSALYTGLMVLAASDDVQAASAVTVMWWLLVALPSSALMWQTRSVSVAMLYRTLAWLAFYLTW